MAIALLIRKLHLISHEELIHCTALEDFRPPTEEGADSLLKDLPILIGKVDSCRTINQETLPSRPRRTDPPKVFRPPA